MKHRDFTRRIRPDTIIWRIGRASGKATYLGAMRSSKMDGGVGAELETAAGHRRGVVEQRLARLRNAVAREQQHHQRQIAAERERRRNVIVQAAREPEVGAADRDAFGRCPEARTCATLEIVARLGTERVAALERNERIPATERQAERDLATDLPQRRVGQDERTRARTNREQEQPHAETDLERAT